MAQSGLVAKATFTYTYFTYSVFLWWPLVVQKCTFTDRPLFDKQKTRYLNLAPPHFYPIVQGIPKGDRGKFASMVFAKCVSRTETNARILPLVFGEKNVTARRKSWFG